MCETIKRPCESDCDDIAGKYVGRISVTKSGYKCQRWDSDYPHRVHNHIRFSKNDRSHNFCQSRVLPQGTDVIPWCYTTDKERRWEKCDLSSCKKKSVKTVLLQAACASIADF